MKLYLVTIRFYSEHPQEITISVILGLHEQISYPMEAFKTNLSWLDMVLAETVNWEIIGAAPFDPVAHGYNEIPGFTKIVEQVRTW
jgi:hypothetical protein